jgi:hypothetical protein
MHDRDHRWIDVGGARSPTKVVDPVVDPAAADDRQRANAEYHQRPEPNDDHQALSPRALTPFGVTA